MKFHNRIPGDIICYNDNVSLVQVILIKITFGLMLVRGLIMFNIYQCSTSTCNSYIKTHLF